MIRQTRRFPPAGICVVLSTILLLTGAGSSARAQTAPASATRLILTVDQAKSTVRWNVDSTLHMVHGTFAVTNGAIDFDPRTGVASGQIVVSATSGESGNSSRDKRMHKEILETAKYPDVIFHPKQIEGKVTTSGSFDVKLSGTLSIHGSDHDITTDVHVEMARDHWTGTAKFEIPYVQWGIKDPSNFLLKVKPVVNVEIEMTGRIETAR